MDFSSIILTGIGTVIATFFGALGGAYAIIKYQESKNSYPRKLISNVLRIFSGYENYDDAQKEFNKYSTVEKKAVIIALKNLGVPIRISIIDDSYDIENVKFDSKPVNKKTIVKMIAFVNKGLCDDLFFKDINSNFYNVPPKTVFARRLAIKYLDALLGLDDSFKTTSVQMDHSDIIRIAGMDFNQYQVIQVFAITVDIYAEASNRTTLQKEKIEGAINNVKNGIFDHLFYWDFRAFRNLLAQHDMVNTLMTSPLLNFKE